MLIENDVAVIVEEDEDLTSIYVGGIWDEFKNLITPPQSKLLTKGFNLIILGSIPDMDFSNMDDFDQLPDTVILNTLPEILLSEEHDITDKKKAVYALLTNNIIEQLSDLGFKLDVEYLSIQALPDLIDLLDFFYILEGYEDLIGLRELLDSQDVEPKERFLTALRAYYGELFDTGNLEYLIEDVSEFTLTALINALKRANGEEEETDTPETFKDRIVNNKDLFKECFVTQHVRMGGALGSTLPSLMSFFSTQLGELLDNPTEDNLYSYSEAVILIHLISEENDHRIKESCLELLSEVITDYALFTRVEAVINKLVLKDE